MTTENQTPAGGPSQAKLDQLAQKLEEHFNSGKNKKHESLSRAWERAHAPSAAFADLREYWSDRVELPRSMIDITAFIIISPIAIPWVIFYSIFSFSTGSWECLRRILRAKSNPPPPSKADLAHEIRFPLSIDRVKSFRDVALIVREQATPFAVYFPYEFTAAGSLIEVGVKTGEKLSRLEHHVLKECKSACPSLVNEADAKTLDAHDKYLHDNRRRLVSEGDPVVLPGAPDGCRKCGGRLIRTPSDFVYCSQCLSPSQANSEGPYFRSR
jgi:hypothetical protein